MEMERRALLHQIQKKGKGHPRLANSSPHLRACLSMSWSSQAQWRQSGRAWIARSLWEGKKPFYGCPHFMNTLSKVITCPGSHDGEAEPESRAMWWERQVFIIIIIMMIINNNNKRSTLRKIYKIRGVGYENLIHSSGPNLSWSWKKESPCS